MSNVVNVEVKEFDIKLDGKKYKFRLDFEALLKFNNRYENALELFNSFLRGENIYDTAIKILSCACNKEMKEEELRKKLGFSFGCMKFIDEVTMALTSGLFVESENKEDEQEKN